MPRRLSWWVALLAALAGGLLLDAAGPGRSWWILAFPAAALIFAAIWQQRAWTGLLVGAIAGASFWLPHISWLTLYLGPVPWLGLTGVMILWFALFGVAVAIATRGLARLPWMRRRPMLTAAAQALAAASLWVAREQIQSTWPYGGFAWGRFGHTQAESPLAQLVSWTGFAGFSGILVLVCAVPVAVWFASRRAAVTRVLAVTGSAVVVLLVLSLIPVAALPESGAIRVAGVQGNAKAGIFDDRDSGDVLEDHIEATEMLIEGLEASGESVDAVVWPENSGEFDLPGNPFAAARVSELSTQLDAPILLGSVLRDPDGTYTNSALVWTPTGESGERYDKRRPVPFAEYMPHRDFYHSLAPDLVDLVSLEYEFGTRPSALPIPAASGTFQAGIAICFDIIFDDHAVAMQEDGAQVIFAPTNNADFGYTDESAQQLQIARLRAIEMGRALVNTSTVGTSAIVAPDGSTLDELPTHTAGAIVAEVPLVDGATPALRYGAGIAFVWITLGIAGLGVGAVSLVITSSRAGRAKA